MLEPSPPSEPGADDAIFEQLRALPVGAVVEWRHNRSVWCQAVKKLPDDEPDRGAWIRTTGSGRREFTRYVADRKCLTIEWPEMETARV